MSMKGRLLQDPFLSALCKERTPVYVFLVNGIRLTGKIEAFDQFVIILRNSVSQMVYKHAVSTVVPAEVKLRLHVAEDGAGEEECSFEVESASEVKHNHQGHQGHQGHQSHQGHHGYQGRSYRRDSGDSRGQEGSGELREPEDS